MTEHEPPEPKRRLDWAGALMQGLLGGLANGTAVGAAGTALRDLAVQDLAQRTADQLRRRAASPDEHAPNPPEQPPPEQPPPG